MPTGARSSIDVLALPVKSAARAALLTAPLVRSSNPRAVAARANSAPASSTSVPVGAAASDANWISRGSDIDRFQDGSAPEAPSVPPWLSRKAPRAQLRLGMMHNTPSQVKRKQTRDPSEG